MDVSVILINPTNVPFKYALYMTLPQSLLCVSVVWKCGDLPAESAPDLTWSFDPEIAIGTVGEASIEAEKTWPAALGKRYTLTYDLEAGDIKAEEDPDSGTSVPDEIIVQNRTGLELAIGMGQDSAAALYMESILSNENVLFNMVPVYHLCILPPTQEVEAGQIVSDPDEEMDGGGIPGTLAEASLSLGKRHIIAQVSLAVDTEGKPALDVSYLNSE